MWRAIHDLQYRSLVHDSIDLAKILGVLELDANASFDHMNYPSRIITTCARVTKSNLALLAQVGDKTWSLTRADSPCAGIHRSCAHSVASKRRLYKHNPCLVSATYITKTETLQVKGYSLRGRRGSMGRSDLLRPWVSSRRCSNE